MAIQDYEARLKALISNPSSIRDTPGYRFNLDQGLEAAQRSGSRMRGSGNVLAELQKLGSGYAESTYGAEVDRLGGLLGQEQQFKLGTDQNANAATRNANDFTLGSQANANTLRRGDQDFGLGMGRLGIDRGRLDLEGRNSAASNATNWFNAVTNRGRAASDSYYQGEGNNRNWYDRFFGGGG